MAEVKEVAVTGGSGYIASRLVGDLLEKGYKVRATVRNPNDPIKVEHLTSLPHSQNLSLHQADLLDDSEKFKAIFQGCDVVFHTASPFQFAFTDPEKDFLQPAVQGTNTVINAALSASVKHIILTSSFASVYYSPQHFSSSEKAITEEDWSDEGFMREKGFWYPLSKTSAEREAWRLVNDYNANHPDQKVRLISINPSFVIGPLLQSTLNTSSSILVEFLTGKRQDIANAYAGFVDVRDVSNAHIIAYENKEAEGRYLCVSEVLHFRDICLLLNQVEEVKSLNPPSQIPTKVQDTPDRPRYVVDTSKLRSLSWQPLSVLQSISDSIPSLISHYNSYFQNQNKN